jgi:cytidylate kinase
LSLQDESGISRLLQSLRIRFSEDGERVFSKVGQGPEEDVSAAIRTPEVTSLVSPVAALAAVREKLTGEQRAIATGRSVVAEGRDTTTVVFPDADQKIFLTASLEERARRRRAERPELRDADLEVVIADIEKRDAMDRGRRIAPLREAAGAIRVDTTGLSQESVVAKLADLSAELLQ